MPKFACQATFYVEVEADSVEDAENRIGAFPYTPRDDEGRRLVRVDRRVIAIVVGDRPEDALGITSMQPGVM